MKQRLLLFLKYYVFWIVFFALQKPVFMIVQYRLLGEVHWQDWFLVPWHGLPLDLSVAAYVTTVFGLLLCVSFFADSRWIRRAGNIYTGIILFVGLWTLLGDNGCFPSWGYHLDKTIFVYLSTPKEALACAPWWVWLSGVVGFVLLFGVVFCLYRRWIDYTTMDQVTAPRRYADAAVCFVVTGLLFLPIRGSVTVSTMNTGRVYFSDNPMLNIAAINPVFNIVESLGEHDFNTAKYTYMLSEEADAELATLLPDTIGVTDKLLNMQRPNVILMIVESLSANTIEVLGGTSGVTPCLNALSQEGVLFTNIYAGSFRTDRGVVAVLSAFPGQPTSSVMTVPAKSRHLPQLSLSLLRTGYRPKFWYGGDEDFTSMRSYLISGGFEDRVCDRDFPVTQRLSKWGVHDHILLARAAEEITHRPSGEKHLDVILTLSSHEPFEVPAAQASDDPYLNAVHYTDSCIGAFVRTLKQSGCWDSTLLVITGDHGYPYPYGLPTHHPLRYRIPVLMVGGAVQTPRRIETLGSQMDIVPSLLAQMGLAHDEYRFGKNLMQSAVVPFAFYSFVDGMALLTKQGAVAIDAKADRVVMQQGTSSLSPDTTLERQARAFIQKVYEAIESL